MFYCSILIDLCDKGFCFYIPSVSYGIALPLTRKVFCVVTEEAYMPRWALIKEAMLKPFKNGDEQLTSIRKFSQSARPIENVDT